MTIFRAVKLIDDAGASYGIKHILNKIRTSAVNYILDIVKGNVSAHTSMDRFGSIENLGITDETIWQPGGLYSYLTVAEQLKVTSDDLNDTSAGTGARTIIIEGLDTNYAAISETVSLNGTTAVTTTNSYLRIFKAWVESNGSHASGTNVGNISIKNNAATTTQAYIKTSYGQTSMALWTVSAGVTFYMVSYGFTTMAGKDTEFHLYFRPFGKSWRVLRDIGMKDSVFIDKKRGALLFDEKTDIEVRANSEVAGGFATAMFDGWTE